MKRKYADGGIYRAEMGVPPMPDEGPAKPMTRAQRMGKISIGRPQDLSPEDIENFSRNPDTMLGRGEEMGMEKKAAKVYKKKLASGGYTKAADGCAKRGKTRGTMVTMSKGGYKK